MNNRWTKNALIGMLLLLPVRGFALSGSEVIYPLGKKGVEQFVAYIKTLDPKTTRFKKADFTVGEPNQEGSSMLKQGAGSYFVYDIDINNDGKNKYFVIYVLSGSLQTSGVFSVIPHEKALLESENYKFNRVVSKNLWGDGSGDLSKFHLWMAAPAVVKRDSKFILRFVDEKPKFKLYEYLWEGRNFKKIRESDTNDY